MIAGRELGTQGRFNIHPSIPFAATHNRCVHSHNYLYECVCVCR